MSIQANTPQEDIYNFKYTYCSEMQKPLFRGMVLSQKVAAFDSFSISSSYERAADSNFNRVEVYFDNSMARDYLFLEK